MSEEGYLITNDSDELVAFALLEVTLHRYYKLILSNTVILLFLPCCLKGQFIASNIVAVIAWWSLWVLSVIIITHDEIVFSSQVWLPHESQKASGLE